MSTQPKTPTEGRLAGYKVTVIPTVLPAQDRVDVIRPRGGKIMMMHRMNRADTDA